MIIPKSTFQEMNEDIEVNVLYPNMQTDVFRNSGSDKVSYIVSTTFGNELYYHYYVGSEFSFGKQTEIIEDLKERLKISVIKSL